MVNDSNNRKIKETELYTRYNRMELYTRTYFFLKLNKYVNKFNAHYFKFEIKEKKSTVKLCKGFTMFFFFVKLYLFVKFKYFNSIYSIIL